MTFRVNISGLVFRGWMGVDTPQSDRFAPGEEKLQLLHRRLGEIQSRSVRLRKISALQGFDPRTVQGVASRFTDCAIPTHQDRLSSDINIQHAVA